MPEETSNPISRIGNLEKSLVERYEAIEKLVKIIKNKENELEILNKIVRSKNYSINQLDFENKNKDLEIKNLSELIQENEKNKEILKIQINDLESKLKQKDLDLIELHKNLQQKDLDLIELHKNLTEFEKIIGKILITNENIVNFANKEFDSHRIENISEKIDNLDYILDKIVHDFERTENEIKILNKEKKNKEIDLINIQSELQLIKNSWTFRSVSKLGRFVDQIFPNGTKRGDLKHVIVASLHHIQNQGFSNYLSAAKTKFSRKEFTIVEPMIISKKDEEGLYEKVVNNRKKRLEPEQHQKNELISDQIDILEEEFSL